MCYNQDFYGIDFDHLILTPKLMGLEPPLVFKLFF